MKKAVILEKLKTQRRLVVGSSLLDDETKEAIFELQNEGIAILTPHKGCITGVTVLTLDFNPF